MIHGLRNGRYWFALIIVILAIVSGLTAKAAIQAQQQADKIQRNTAKIAATNARLLTLEQQLHDAAMGECKRVNILRGRVNTNTIAIHSAFKTLQNHLGQDITTRNDETRIRLEDLKMLTAATNTLRITPLTDCQQAVEHPLSYVPPQPEPIR